MANATEKVLLLYEPHILRLQLLVRLRKLEVKPPHNLRNQFRNLEDRNILANARSRTCAKLHANR
jgi:hypothetical protein